MKILVTGAAGFIGFHLTKRLAERGDEVVGLDNINDYYDVRLKYGRLNEVGIEEKDIEYNKFVQSNKYGNYRFLKLDITDRENLQTLFKEEHFDKVMNLAAQAGVQVKDDPQSYVYLMPIESAGHNDVLVGPIRKTLAEGNGLTIWLTGDQIRKGAALNAVQIAEYLISKK